jgi:hypothetical protein
MSSGYRRFEARLKSQTLAAFVASKSPKGRRATREQGGGAGMAAVSSGEGPFLKGNSPFGNPD